MAAFCRTCLSLGTDLCCGPANDSNPLFGVPPPPPHAERVLFFRTPLDFLFWFCTFSCIGALFGLAGIFSAQPTLVIVFFAYNLVQTVLSFNLFVDVLAGERLGRGACVAFSGGWVRGAACMRCLGCMCHPEPATHVVHNQQTLRQCLEIACTACKPQTRASGTWVRRQTWRATRKERRRCSSSTLCFRQPPDTSR